MRTRSLRHPLLHNLEEKAVKGASIFPLRHRPIITSSLKTARTLKPMQCIGITASPQSTDAYIALRSKPRASGTPKGLTAATSTSSTHACFPPSAMPPCVPLSESTARRNRRLRGTHRSGMTRWWRAGSIGGENFLFGLLRLRKGGRIGLELVRSGPFLEPAARISRADHQKRAR